MDVYEAIRARRTIRDFEDRQVGMGTIERIIDAGLKAPTNNHLRQWEFVIVNGKEERANLLRVENMTSRDECEQRSSATCIVRPCPGSSQCSTMPDA